MSGKNKDQSSSEDNESKFVDTWLGKVTIGITIATVSGILAWIGSRITYDPPPLPSPSASIRPIEKIVPAGEIIDFSAADSQFPSPSRGNFFWKVSGQNYKDSTVAKCKDKGEVLSCRFVLPGTFSVTVTAIDENQMYDTASASVTTEVKNGYIGLILQNADKRAMQALLYDIDWAPLAAQLVLPLLLEDPDTGAPVYAINASPPPNTPDPPIWRGAAKNLKIVMPWVPEESKEDFYDALSSIGLIVLDPQYGVTFASQSTGNRSDGGAIYISGPAEFLAKIAELR